MAKIKWEYLNGEIGRKVTENMGDGNFNSTETSVDEN